eukprot:3774687-Rhodomonas_salina.2
MHSKYLALLSRALKIARDTGVQKRQNLESQQVSTKLYRDQETPTGSLPPYLKAAGPWARPGSAGRHSATAPRECPENPSEHATQLEATTLAVQQLEFFFFQRPVSAPAGITHVTVPGSRCCDCFCGDYGTSTRRLYFLESPAISAHNGLKRVWKDGAAFTISTHRDLRGSGQLESVSATSKISIQTTVTRLTVTVF